MSADDAASLRLVQNDRVILKNDLGSFEGRVFLAPIARGNLQIHWPEGNAIIRRGVVDAAGGVPDYNARVIVERPEKSGRTNEDPKSGHPSSHPPLNQTE